MERHHKLITVFLIAIQIALGVHGNRAHAQEALYRNNTFSFTGAGGLSFINHKIERQTVNYAFDICRYLGAGYESYDGETHGGWAYFGFGVSSKVRFDLTTDTSITPVTFPAVYGKFGLNITNSLSEVYSGSGVNFDFGIPCSDRQQARRYGAVTGRIVINNPKNTKFGVFGIFAEAGSAWVLYEKNGEQWIQSFVARVGIIVAVPKKGDD